MGIITGITISFIYIWIPLGIIRGIIYAFILKKSYVMLSVYSCIANGIAFALFGFGGYFFSKKIQICFYNFKMFNATIILTILCFIIFSDICFFKWVVISSHSLNIKSLSGIVLYWSSLIVPLAFVQEYPPNITITSPEEKYPYNIKVVVSRAGSQYKTPRFSAKTEISSSERKKILPIHLERSYHDDQYDIETNPYGGLIYSRRSRKSSDEFIKLNFQVFFYRWSPATFYFNREAHFIIFSTRNENFIYDCNKNKLYVIQSGTVYGIMK